jgi:transcriptional regulator with XRE-family HTH domain
VSKCRVYKKKQPTPKKESPGSRMKELRRGIGLSQLAVSEIIGISMASYCLMEHDKIYPEKHVYKLSKVFGVAPEYILMESDDKQYKPSYIRKYEQLPAEYQSMIDKYINKIHDKYMHGKL